MRTNRDWLALLIQILMAVAGALARIFNMSEPTETKWILGQVFIAGFTGALLYWVSAALQLDEGWTFALAGIAGWMGPRALDGILSTIRKHTGIDLTGKGEK